MDLAFPSALLGLLDWTRTYNARNAAAGALGPGWSTAFSAFLTTAADGVVEFHDEDGRTLRFVPDGPGRFRRAQDLDADLIQHTDGSYTLAYNSGQGWNFTASGQLTGRTWESQSVAVDRNGDGRPVRAVHSLGRYLSFFYDDAGHLVTVAASDGRAISLGYAESGTLASITDPSGGVTRYESTASGVLTSVTDPDGVLLLTNSYDDTGRVARQDLPGGGHAEFSYDDASSTTTVTGGPVEGTSTFAANSDGRLVRLVDAAGNAASFSYDDNGYLAESVTPRGTPLVQEHDGNGNLLRSEFGGATSTWTYDAANRVTTATIPTGATTDYTYTGDSHIPTGITGPTGAQVRQVVENGLVTSSTDADGGTTGYAYDSAGNLVTITDPLGEISRLTYDPAGNRLTSTAPSGAENQWAYDNAGRVTAYTDAAGGITEFRYRPSGRLAQRVEPDGATTGYSYDAAGNRTSITDPAGQTTAFGYDGYANLTSITDPAGGTSAFSYDAVGRMATSTDATGAVTSYTYDADGNNTESDGPRGIVRSTYDDRGNPITTTDPANATMSYAYDPADQLTSLTDPLNGTWRLGYDPAGNVTSVTDPTGAAGTMAWTPAGRLDTTTDPLGRQTKVVRDARGNPTEIIDPAGGSTRYTYDQDGRRIAVTTPAGLLTRYTLDTKGRVIATTDPRGWITRTEYNARNQKTAVISPSGTVTRYRYDAAGRLAELIDGNGSPSQYGYDGAGRLIEITDAKGAVTRFDYDKAGRLTARTDPLGRTTRRDYDKAGNLITLTDPSGHAQHFAYDGDGRLTQQTADDTPSVSYTYDQAGRRLSMTDATGTTHYAYDGAGRLTEVTDPDGGVIRNGYDRAGQRTSLTYPDGLTVGYGYDPNGRLIALRDSKAGDAAYALDPDGRLLTEQLPGRLARRYHYDGGLLRRFAVVHDDHPVFDTRFTHDPDGRVRTQHDHGHRREFRYDRAGQLVGVRHWEQRPWPWEPREHREPEPEQGFWIERRSADLGLTYDVAGNRVSLRHGEREDRYRYDAADQLVASESHGERTDYRYDTSGRLTERISGEHRRVLGYDGFGRLASVTDTGPELTRRLAAVPDGDGLVSRLVLSTVDEHETEERGSEVRYRWSTGDAIPQILTQRAEPETDDAEHDRPGRLSADFAYGYGRTFASWAHGAEPLHHDAYGSQVRTEATEAWTQAREYNAFGVPEHDDDHHHEPGPELPRFGYRGELALGSILDLRARDYDARLGRFSTPDPLLLGLPSPGQATNPYVYANNDPVNHIDPLGTFAIVPAAGGQVRALGPVFPQATTPATLTSITTLLAKGAGGDQTTLHTAACYIGAALLATQMTAEFQFPPNHVYFEARITGAPKYRLYGNPPQPPGGPNDSYGKADILFEYFTMAGEVNYIWEVKSAITTADADAAAQANREAQWYVDAYNQNVPFALNKRAEIGAPLQTQGVVNITGFADIRVYSVPNVNGNVLYKDDPTNVPPPVDVPVFQYQPQTKQVRQVYGPQLTPIGARAFQTVLSAGGVNFLEGAVGAAAVGGIFAIILRILTVAGEAALAAG